MKDPGKDEKTLLVWRNHLQTTYLTKSHIKGLLKINSKNKKNSIRKRAIRYEKTFHQRGHMLGK